jgi:DNA-binding response OmpR family regulator
MRQVSDREVPLDGTGRVVVVAEHRASLRRKLCDDLERYGYTVFEAKDGAQALQLSKHLQSPADLLIADRDLPQLSAKELVDELTAAHVLPKVLLVSRASGKEAPRHRADALPSIALPIGAAELARSVDELLNAEK